MNESPSDPDGQTADLSRRVRAGDRAAFQELYERTAPMLYAWAQLRTQGSPASAMDPQDVLQEAWLRAVRAFEDYDPTRSFRRWILGITKNVLLQGYRRLANDPTRQAKDSPAEPEVGHCPDSVTSISLRLSKDDSMRRFLAYVSELPSDDRQLVLYCAIEEYTCAEAAERLGLTPDAASKRWQSLRARMRENGALRALALEEAG